MYGYLSAVLAPFVTDKAVWMSVFGWAFGFLNSHFGFGVDAHTLDALNAAMSVYTVGHLSHSKFFGGNGNA